MVAPGGVRGCFGGGGCVVFARWACVVFARGCVWFFPGGMHGLFQGACMVFARGCVVFSQGGMRGFFRGACMVFSGGVCAGYDEIRSMSGRYASYWNAFLFTLHVTEHESNIASRWIFFWKLRVHLHCRKQKPIFLFIFAAIV